ncbi:MoaF C-terminal domain-containing protein [Amycolatopsis sp. NPDC004772]
MLPQTSALEGWAMSLELDGEIVTLGFADGIAGWSHHDGRSGADPYDAVEVAPDIFFIDVWRRSHSEREALTLIVDRTSGRAMSVLTTVNDHAVPGKPRITQTFAAGTLAGVDVEQSPAETRDLLGRRLVTVYSPELVYEHVYLNSRLCAWQCIRGDEPGKADCDEATYWRFAENLYVFAFRERMIPCASVILLDLTRSRSTGKFLEIEDGKIHNGGIGSDLHLLPAATYPDGLSPL